MCPKSTDSTVNPYPPTDKTKKHDQQFSFLSVNGSSTTKIVTKNLRSYLWLFFFSYTPIQTSPAPIRPILEIYPGASQFSPPPLLPSWCKPVSYVTWIIQEPSTGLLASIHDTSNSTHQPKLSPMQNSPTAPNLTWLKPSLLNLLKGLHNLTSMSN